MTKDKAGRTAAFTLPYPDGAAARRDWARWYGLDAYWSGKHWGNRKRDADFWQTLVTGALARQGVPRRPFLRPVKITFYWNDRLGIDRHAVMGRLIADSLKGWLLQGDSRRWYAACEHRFHDGAEIRVELRELPAAEREEAAR